MAKKLVLLALLLLLAQGAAYYPRMPAVMATHFGGQGRPNGWMTVGGAIKFELAIVGLMLFAFVGLPKLLRRLDPRLINIPNKDYWLAPERRESSLDALENRMNGFGVVVLLFIGAIHQLVFAANRNPPPVLDNPLTLAAGLSFLAAMATWIVMLLRRFRAPG